MSKESNPSLTGNDPTRDSRATFGQLLDATIGLFGVAAVELWGLHSNAEPQRIDAVYRGLPRAAQLPGTSTDVRILVEQAASANSATAGGRFSLHYAAGIPFGGNGRRYVLVLFSYSNLKPESETVLRATELIARLSTSCFDYS